MIKKLLPWMPASFLLVLFGLLWSLASAGGQRGVIMWLLLQQVLPLFGGLVLIGSLVFAIWKKRLTIAGIAYALVTFFAIWPFFWRMGLLPIRYPISLEDTAPAATVRLPSNAPLLVAWGGDRVQVNYHVVLPDQRWAYDLVVEPAFHGSNRLEDYGCWGVPVVAPASGTVIVAQDGEVDHMPGQDSEGYGYPGGNHVFIELETGTFLAIGHLQEGSVLVNEGDWVEEGQEIGRCGNSGSTSEPHIHIHHQQEDPRATAAGLAEGLPLFFRNHDGPPMPEGGLKSTASGIIPLGPIIRHIGN